MIYTFTLFTLAFETAHLIFAVKYWNLSLRLVQMLNKEVIPKWQTVKVKIVFWSIQLLIVTAMTCLVALGNLELTTYHGDIGDKPEPFTYYFLLNTV